MNPVIGKPIRRWSGPIFPFNEGQWNRGQQFAENRRAQREAENAEAAKFQDEHLAKMDKAYKEKRAKEPSYPYVAPGEQGTLFSVDEPERKELPKRESAASINAQAKQLHQQLIDKGTLPPTEKMKPSRQVSVWTEKPHLPKKTGGQGTLMAPRRYR